MPVSVSGVNTFTIRYDRIPHHTQIRVLAATVVPEKPIPMDNNETVHHEYAVAGQIPSGRQRSKAEHVRVAAIYTARGKSFSVEIPEAIKRQELKPQ